MVVVEWDMEQEGLALFWLSVLYLCFWGDLGSESLDITSYLFDSIYVLISLVMLLLVTGKS